MKKIFLIICLAFILISLIPAQTNAALVPCGWGDPNPSTMIWEDPNTETSINEACSCSFCHLFTMMQNIIDFLIFRIVPVTAVLILFIGGLIFFSAGTNPNSLEKAKKLITSTIFGLVIIFTAWLVINTLMTFIGVSEWTGLKNWWQIDCPTPDDTNDSDFSCMVDNSMEIGQKCVSNQDCVSSSCVDNICR